LREELRDEIRERAVVQRRSFNAQVVVLLKRAVAATVYLEPDALTCDIIGAHRRGDG
jgi:hypothetical protein